MIVCGDFFTLPSIVNQTMRSAALPYPCGALLFIHNMHFFLAYCFLAAEFFFF